MARLVGENATFPLALSIRPRTHGAEQRLTDLFKKDLVADTWIKMIRGSKCRGWTKGKGGTDPKEKAQPRAGLNAPMNIKRANLRVDKESTAGVCSSVSRTEQITRAVLMFPWPGCFLFLSSSLVSRCFCCCSCRAGVAFSILERNYARRGEEGGGGREGNSTGST